MRVTMLGCGGSGGVPLITGHWGRCDPSNPRTARRRPSILVEDNGSTILVDTGPDLRAQLLDAGCRRVDAVLYTHAHADHVHGIDDLRGLNFAMGGAIDAYGRQDTLHEIARRFSYVFEQAHDGTGPFRPQLTANLIGRDFRAAGIDVVAFDQDHGDSTSTGFRFGPFAYSTDIVGLNDAAFALLAGVEVWIVGCLRADPHPAHAHLERVLQWVERLKPERAILTHMNHTMDYAELAATLPSGVEPGFDGLAIEIE